MKRKRIGYYADLILIMLGIGLIAQAAFTDAVRMLVWPGLALLAFGCLAAVLTQRCPVCGRYLGAFFFDGRKRYCPYCGADLERTDGR